MAATETKTGFPNPPAWLTLIIAAVVGFGTARYEAGQNEQRLKDLETFKTNTEARWERERQAREAKFEKAELDRNSQKDEAVQAMLTTASELRTELQTLKSSKNGKQ